MAQTWSTNPFDSAHNWDDDMAALENALMALQSAFSGSASPSSPVPGQFWMVTAATGTGLRYRNNADTAWRKVLTGDASQKMWVYRNDTCEGWTIDATVTDRVLAIKGGSDEYNINGGETSTEGRHSHEVKIWAEEYWRGTGSPSDIHDFSQGTYTPDIIIDYKYVSGGIPTAWTQTSKSYFVHSDTPGGSKAHIGHGVWGNTEENTASRPAAAVGTLQYPDLS